VSDYQAVPALLDMPMAKPMAKPKALLANRDMTVTPCQKTCFGAVYCQSSRRRRTVESRPPATSDATGIPITSSARSTG
jgi:hypothetical protein